MGSKGSNTTTTSQSQQYTPNPLTQQAGTQALQQAMQAAGQPFQPYTGNQVAGFSPDQLAAFNAVNNLQGGTGASTAQAQNYINASTTPSAYINQYLNPFLSNQVAATQQAFNLQNAQQQQQVLGNAIASGAFGGDRAKVAQAQLAGQQAAAQAPVIAGMETQGYNTALAAAQNQAQAMANAGYATGNLGFGQQGAALQALNAQLGTGGLQQQLAQQQLNVPYAQYLQRLAYPYQQAQFLSGIAGASPATLGYTQAGQGTTTTTPAQPSILSQVAGLAGLVGSFFSKGGAVQERADGGPILSASLPIPVSPISGNVPQMRQMNLNPAGNISVAPNPFAIGQTTGEGLSRLSNAISNMSNPFDSLSQGTIGGTSVPGIGPLYARGGGVERLAVGGGASFDDRFSAADTLPQVAPVTPDEMRGVDPYTAGRGALANSFQALGQEPLSNLGLGQPYNPETPAPGTDIPPSGPVAPPVQTQDVSLPPNAQPSMYQPGGQAPLDLSAQQAPLDLSAQQAPVQASTGKGSSILGIPREQLRAMSLGILAGGSPFPLVNIGQGALAGQQAYETQQAKTRQLDLEAKRLEQQAKQHADTLSQQWKIHSSMTPYQALESQKPVVVRQDVDQLGRVHAIYGVRQPDGTFLDPTTGKKIEATEAGGSGPGDVFSVIATPRPSNLGSNDRDEAFLTQLKATNPAMALDVERIANGYGRFPALSGARGPGAAYGLMLRQALNRYAPNVDETSFPQMQRQANDWTTSGKAGQTITAFNFAGRHTADLGELTKGLNPSQVRAINATKNWIGTQFSDPQLEAWRNQALIVSTEVPKMLRGAGVLNEQEEKRWGERLMGSPNVETFLGGLGQLGHAMQVRNDELISQYRGIMHRDPPYTLSPEARKSFDQLESWRQQYVPGAKPSGGGGVPPISQREVGKVYQTPKGSFKWTGSGWQRAE